MVALWTIAKGWPGNSVSLPGAPRVGRASRRFAGHRSPGALECGAQRQPPGRVRRRGILSAIAQCRRAARTFASPRSTTRRLRPLRAGRLCGASVPRSRCCPVRRPAATLRVALPKRPPGAVAGRRTRFAHVRSASACYAGAFASRGDDVVSGAAGFWLRRLLLTARAHALLPTGGPPQAIRACQAATRACLTPAHPRSAPWNSWPRMLAVAAWIGSHGVRSESTGPPRRPGARPVAAAAFAVPARPPPRLWAANRVNARTGRLPRRRRGAAQTFGPFGAPPLHRQREPCALAPTADRFFR